MHEFNLCQQLIKTLRGHTRVGRERRLVAIEITLGPLCGITREPLQNAFPIALQATEFENLDLTVTETAIVVECLHCQQTSKATANDLRCRHCQSNHTLLLTGNECSLTHLYYGEGCHV